MKKDDRVKCEYGGIERLWYPDKEACRWHVEVKDPQCKECQRYQVLLKEEEKKAAGDPKEGKRES